MKWCDVQIEVGDSGVGVPYARAAYRHARETK